MDWNILRIRPAQRLVVGVAVLAAAVACAPAPTAVHEETGGLTIVFVHGAWAGGWHFNKVAPLLEGAGHTVYRPTMTGLGERVHLARADVDLSTHIEDIVMVFEFEDLQDVVLVGHSYGGMVVAGVAERVPQRIKKLVFMDAIVPENGDSVSGLFGDSLDLMATAGGGGAEPWKLVPRWVEPGKQPPVDVPQPILTFTEEIVLDNPEAARLPGVFILTVEAGETTDDFDPFADRSRARGWTVIEMEGGHNPHWFQPEAFVEVLLQAAR